MDFISLKRKRCSASDSVTGKRGKSGKGSFSGDPRLLPRVKELLSLHKYSRRVDDEELFLDLLETYPEYKRKKKRPLKFAIQKALNMCADDICEEIPENFDDVDDDFSPDTDKYVAYEDTNLMNKALRGLYKDTQLEKESESYKSPTAFASTIQNTVPLAAEGDTTQKELKLEKVKSISQKTKKSAANKVPVIEKSNVTFADIGGIEDTLQDVSKLLFHLKHPIYYETLGVTPPGGFLLHGPPGCGKTLIAHAIAGELGLPFIEVAATELVSGISGESESKIRELFDGAVNSAPCILFIDEIDAITPKRESAQKGMEKRIVSQLLKCMDDLNGKGSSSQVMFIGATNRPDSLDPALRRAGRFDREIRIGIPNEKARIGILRVLCKNLKLIPNFDFHWLAKITPGYVGADLMAVIREAAVVAIDRIFQKCVERVPHANACLSSKEVDAYAVEPLKNSLVGSDPQTKISWLQDIPPLTDDQLQELYLDTSDFQAAVNVCQPSAKREGFAAIPNVTWDDVGALKKAREELQNNFLLPIKHRNEFERYHLTSISGVLLCGPKGCGKTLLAKAVANECSINFLSVKGPELFNMYVGETERAVRQCFQRARDAAPCVIFFDEVDALCPSRSGNTENAVADRVVNQLLTEIDGVESTKTIFVMGATNRPDNIDSAMLRAGRFEKVLYIDLPTAEERIDILKKITKNGTQPMLAKDVDIRAIAVDSRCDGFSGADLDSLVRAATFQAFINSKRDKETENQPESFEISQSHFEAAFSEVHPTVSEKEQKFFKEMASKFLKRS